MTNEELFSKIKKEIPHYQIGFHQISLHKYHDVIENGGARAVDYKIDGEEITEKSIANQILKKGFNVWDRGLGLMSTSFFPEELSADRFNYKYYQNAASRVYNVLLAVPYCLTYNGKSYFIGNLNMPFSFGNRLLFNDGVIPEFIYGYYEKETPITYRDSVCEYHFSDELIFYENGRFWLNLSAEEQKQVLQKLFAEKKKAYRVLRLINNHNPLGLLAYGRLERLVIRKMREQKKVYVKSLNH